MSLLWKLKSLLRRGQLDAELEEEVAFHLEMRERQLLDQGVAPEKARNEARRRFGNRTQARENSRAYWGFRRLEDLGQDLQFACRTLGKHPGFSVAAIATLAVSIGMSTAIFSVVHALVFEPLPYAEPNRLVMLWATNQAEGIDLATARRRRRSMDLQEVMDWKRESSVFESIVAFEGWTMPVLGPVQPRELFAYAVSDGFLETVGVQPLIGRGFLPEELEAGTDSQVLLLTYDYWLQAFDADPGVVGTELRVGRTRERTTKPYKVIGVLPHGFKFHHRRAAAFAPLFWGMDQRTRRGQQVMARLKQGVTIEQAQQEAATISDGLARRYPDASKGWTIQLVPVADDSIGAIRPVLSILVAAVASVLLIACINMAAFLMIRLDGRSRELAMRSTLGASRSRLLQQVLTESLVLSGAGGLLGLGLSWLLIVSIRDLDAGANSFARHLIGMESVSINGAVAAFAVTATACSGLLFAAIPAWRAAGLGKTLSVPGARATTSPRGRLLRQLVVATQVSLTVILVVSTGLLARSFAGLLDRDLGFQPDKVVYVSLPRVHFDVLERLQEETNSEQDFEAAAKRWLSLSNQAVVEGVASIPGVQSAGVGGLLLGDDGFLAPVEAKAGSTRTGSDGIEAYWEIVSSDALQTLRVSPLRGRFFEAADVRRSSLAALVNQTFASRMWPGLDPLSREFTAWGEMTFVVVGVVGDMRHLGPRGPHIPAFFWDAERHPSKNLGLVVRSSVDPVSLVPQIRRVAMEIDPTLIFRKAETVEDKVLISEWQLQYSLLLLGGLALGALALAVVGIYGTLNHAVGQRTREIGVRMAVGARSSEIMRLVIYQGLAVVGAGLAAGLLGAAAVTRFIESLLFQVHPTDISTFAVTAAGFFATAVLASYFPARRASNVDPVVSLRCE